MSIVVNVKVKNIRPKYQNLKEWIEDKNNEYIGRNGIVFIDKERYPKIASIWCNPYKIGKDGDRDMVIEKYEKYIKDKIEKDDNMRIKLLELKDKTLGCWCYPEKCHGDILIKLISEYNI